MVEGCFELLLGVAGVLGDGDWSWARGIGGGHDVEEGCYERFVGHLVVYTVLWWIWFSSDCE